MNKDDGKGSDAMQTKWVNVNTPEYLIGESCRYLDRSRMDNHFSIPWRWPSKSSVILSNCNGPQYFLASVSQFFGTALHSRAFLGKGSLWRIISRIQIDPVFIQPNFGHHFKLQFKIFTIKCANICNKMTFSQGQPLADKYTQAKKKKNYQNRYIQHFIQTLPNIWTDYRENMP